MMVTLVTPILREDGEISLPPQPQFDVAKIFAAADRRDIKIGGHFKEWFSGKIEPGIGSTTLCYYKLVRKSPDSVIMAELGDHRMETRIAQMAVLMNNQLYGEEGVLLTNTDQINVFYIKDAGGRRRMVYVCRGRKRWFIGVSLIDDLYPGRYALTPPGVRIFSQA